MKKLSLVLVMIVLFGGCSYTTRDGCIKDGVSHWQLSEDQRICRESLSNVPDEKKKEEFDSCMKNKGYKWGAALRNQFGYRIYL